MNRPTLTQARAWRPDALRRLADAWEDTAREIHDRVQAGSRAAAESESEWVGTSADAARHEAMTFADAGDAVARALVLAAVAARDGADQIGQAQATVLARVDAARDSGYGVADDGSVTPHAPPPLLLLLAGGDAGAATEMLAAQAATTSQEIVSALHLLGAADEDAARDLQDAFDSLGRTTDIALGDTNGVPWEVRIAANRTHVAQAVVDGLGGHDSAERIAFYRGLLSEIDDPAGSGRRIDRKILAFDPPSDLLVELNGDVTAASSVAVLVPGMNTTIEGSTGNTVAARQFVSATQGRVAAITYLGGPFPADDNVLSALAEAASPRFAVDMAPGLVAFSRDVDANVDAVGRSMGRSIPVTYVGHSYGGSILGTAEAMGLTADRTLYVAAAGAGVGVERPEDWHNRNPHVLRFSMTAPADPIQLVQGLPGSPHGADPDEMPGVIHLATGRYDDGRPMVGLRAHCDVIDVAAADAWRNVLAVITGDRAHIVLAG